MMYFINVGLYKNDITRRLKSFFAVTLNFFFLRIFELSEAVTNKQIDGDHMVFNFSQEDVDNGRLSYFHQDLQTFNDSVTFIVFDSHYSSAPFTLPIKVVREKVSFFSELFKKESAMF